MEDLQRQNAGVCTGDVSAVALELDGPFLPIQLPAGVAKASAKQGPVVGAWSSLCAAACDAAVPAFVAEESQP
ncbi:MAG: hypothetical protein LBT57_01935 [Puniceicoccales bacterium]|nr:hypothetical protein [Puniceicoccales bacterium]